MLEFLAYKKFKKNKKDKEDARKDGKDNHAPSSSKDKQQGDEPAKAERRRSESPTPSVAPVLDQDDESFLESLLGDDAPPPALPPRIKTPEVSWESDDSRLSAEHSRKGKERDVKVKDKDKEHKRFSLNFLTSILDKDKDKKALTLAPPRDTSKAAEGEVGREEVEMSRVLNDLNLSARNNRAFSLTSESTELARRFNQVLRDLVRGVPTAVNDLQQLVEDRDGLIERTYEKLPSSLKKLVEKMPEKMTASLAPELLAAAAESQGKHVDKGAGLGDAAKGFLSPKNLTELVTKPGAVVGMLRAIVNALKLRWPAFIGTNVIWSVAVFLLLFVLWYCYKRGREERIKDEEAADGGTHEDKRKDKKDKSDKKHKKGHRHRHDADDDLEVEDVTDQHEPAADRGAILPAPHPLPIINEPGEEPPTRGAGTDLPPPPIGEHAKPK